MNWILLAIAVVVPLIYFLVLKQRNRKVKSEKNIQVDRKELLDAILKNNKDRYQA